MDEDKSYMHNVSFTEKNMEFKVEDEAVLFDALDDQGEMLPHGCLSGSCGSCRVEITEGAQNLKAPSPIEEDTIESIKTNLKRIHGKDYDDSKVIRLSCRARVLGDIKFKTI